MTVVKEQEASALFLQDLRKRTAEWHKKLEETDISRQLLSPTLSLDDYKWYLQRMLGYLQPFEHAIEGDAEALYTYDFIINTKSNWLVQDLLALGMSEKELARLTQYDFPTQLSFPQKLGALYVMEGSTLGGTVIYKHMNSILGLDEHNGGQYFKGYGSETGGRWRAFIHALANFAVSHKAEEEIINTATSTFKQLHGWFTAIK